MPAICKYFLQGNCRFGDKCRFYHPQDDEAYDENYDENYGDGPMYRGQQQPQQQQRYPPQQPRGNFGQFDGRFDQRQGNLYGRQPQPQPLMASGRLGPAPAASGYDGSGDASKYKWVSPLRRESIEQQQQQQGRQQISHQPLSVATTEQRRGSLPQPSPSPVAEAEDYAEMILNDMQTWMESNQWVFSCYGFASNKPCAFGFPDFSFEELRAEALEAEKNGTIKEHRQKLANMERSYNNLQDRLLNLNDFDYEQLIRGIRAHLKLHSSNGKVDFGPDLTFKWPISSRRGSRSSIQPQQLQPKNDSSSSAGPSGFSFTLPVNQSSRKESISNESFYTPMDRLSEEEKAAFKAATFQTGAVPIHPPAAEFCK